MHTNSSTVQSAQAINDGLAGAIAAAGYAPSIRNTQPWWWCLDGDTANLYLERSRVRTVTDPDLRQAILSCGAALHHVRTTLAAEGWRVAVTRMPDIQFVVMVTPSTLPSSVPLNRMPSPRNRWTMPGPRISTSV